MGVDVSLKVKSLTLLYWKSFFDEKTLRMFFNQSDLQINNNVKYDINDKDEKPHTEYKYVSTVGNVVDRLNSIGYTLKNVEKRFNNNVFDIINYYDFDEEDGVIRQRIEKNVTFKKWSNSVKKYSNFLLNNDEDLYYFWELEDHGFPESLKPKTFCDRIVFNSLKDTQSDSYFGCLYEEFDSINVVRLILEYCDKKNIIEVDVSEMVGWTYDSIDDMRISDNIEKTIVLVEGSSDKTILEFALKNIYPHLYNLYYFMDFDYSTNNTRQGGSDAIAKNIETFITSKLNAKFIAIFDNDAIGIQSQKALLYKIGNFPENYKITNYPPIKDANKYPTILPDKKIKLMNINSMACSIELYLPKQLITDDFNNLYPIQWKNIVERKIGNEKLSDYQGEIQHKDEIKSSFMSLKNDIENGKKQFNIDDWKNIKTIIDHIIHIFD